MSITEKLNFQLKKKPPANDYKIQVISQNEDPNKTQRISGSTKLIDASCFKDTYKNMFRIDLTPKLHSIQKRINKRSIKFGKIIAASWGARGVPVKNFHFDKPINKKCKKMVKGLDVDRYGLIYSEKWLLYDVKKLYRPSMPEFFENNKIIFQKVTGERSLIGAYDDNKFYTDDSLICCIPKYCFEGFNEKKLRKHKIYIYEEETEISKDYDLLFILAVMNSQSNGFYFLKFVGYDLNVYPENIESLPIPKINFITPKTERTKIVARVAKLYDNSKFDGAIKWIENELSENRTDTIHDLLAYLAEQMIEMNKEKNKETKGFLKWLERETGTEIENLSNKTALKEYHNHDFNKLLEILKKNKNKISIDPSERKIQEQLEKEYTKSMSVLTPLKEKIQKTDDLIDQIVYKLYGLTDEEVKIVGGNSSC